jgi:GrpB-like predicted nucleotidyltransferase (UPF0157 family)
MHFIEIIQYNPNWIALFTQEKNNIEKYLDSGLIQIHHIGSTAIPGMAAKPIIDILLEIATLDGIDQVEQQLLALNYTKFNRSVIPYRSFFTHKSTTDYQVSCHIFEMGDPQITRHIRFRDYLCSHENRATQYAELKSQLAKKSGDIGQYVMGKSELVRAIDVEAKLWDSNQGYNNHRLPQNKGLPFENWSVTKINQAIEANFTVMFTHFMQYCTPIHFERVPGYVLIDTKLPAADFNLVLDIHLTPPEAEQTVQKISQHFSQETRPFTWWITPSSKPNNLALLLAEQHFHHQETRIGMIIDLDHLQNQPSHTYSIVKFENANMIKELSKQLCDKRLPLKQYLDWVAEIYTPDDPIVFYAVYSGNTLIRCAILVLYSQCAGIYHLAETKTSCDPSKVTIENFLLEEAKKEKYHLAFVIPRDNESDTYKSRGFITQCAFQKWQISPTL